MTAYDKARHRWGCQNSDSPKNGSSNSRSADTNCPPASQNEARIGVDTISWGWSDVDAVDRFMRLDGLVTEADDPRPLRVVPAPGRAVRLSRRIDGLGTVGAFPAASMLFVEGRARALHRRDEKDHGLAHVSQLSDTEDQVLTHLGSLLGRRPEAPAALRRVDLTGEIRFDRGEDGRELLSLLDLLHIPRHKLSPVREQGGPGVETVYWRTAGRSVPVLRAYDKGVESKTAPPGERIRIERQIRYGSQQRPALGQFLQGDLAALYAKPLRRWLAGGTAIGTAGELLRLLTDAALIWPKYWSSGSSWASRTGTVHCSLWPARKVERVVGILALIDAYGAAWPAWSPKQRQRRMAEVRELGVVVVDQPVSIDLDGAIDSLCALWEREAC